MPILAFGSFRLDTHALELRRDGLKVRIRPQPCRLLVLLASRPGQLITREELRAALWPDVFVRFDLGLNSCLKQIRAALGESAGAPRHIETLSRRGYRFIADGGSNGNVGGGWDDDDSCAKGGGPHGRRVTVRGPGGGADPDR
jgi:DNA-binding winged helix-turn-helix (wHTH) protein